MTPGWQIVASGPLAGSARRGPRRVAPTARHAMRGIVRGATVLALAASFAACAEGTAPDAAVDAVTLAPGDTTLRIGAVITARATGRDVNGELVVDRAVVWSSSAPAIVRVDDEGRLEALAAGSATIAASIGGRSATSRIDVITPPVVSVGITPPATTLAVGSTAALVATARDADGREVTGRSVTWGSDAPDIALVSATGVVTAVAPGVATITARVDGRSGTAAVTVTRVPVASITLTPARDTLAAGATRTFVVTLRDAGGAELTDRTVIWSVVDPDIASVSSTGVVTARVPGVTAVAAASEGRVATAPLTVVAQLANTVAILPGAATLVSGDSLTLLVRITDAQGELITGRPVSYASSAPGVASVSAAGLVRAIAPGVATITATSDGRGGTARIEVVPVPVARVVITPPTLALEPGAARSVTATALAADGATLAGRTVTWLSGAPLIAAVTPTSSDEARVDALGEGVATVLAIVDGVVGTLTVDVQRAPVASVVVTPVDPVVAIGSTVDLVATVRDAQGRALIGRDVLWRSDDPSIAFVSSTGRVVARASGRVRITATSEGVSGSVFVTVP